MNREQVLKKLLGFKPRREGNKRWPHKPLLLLYALGQLRQGHSGLHSFSEVRGKLTNLLEKFGPPRKVPHPEAPFYRLSNDGIWELRQVSDKARQMAGGPSEAQMVKDGTQGGFLPEIDAALRADLSLVDEAAAMLLQNEFEESYHEDIRKEVGLERAWKGQQRSQRDREFRKLVITAYESRCAICDYDIRLNDELVGVDAAHILWHAYDGPDEVPNGLALCAVHHRALDRGGISLDDDLSLRVSSQFAHSKATQTWFLRFNRQPIREPRNRNERPDPRYLKWHRGEVFRGPAI